MDFECGIPHFPQSFGRHEFVSEWPPEEAESVL
jgi:hypothetical protein